MQASTPRAGRWRMFRRVLVGTVLTVLFLEIAYVVFLKLGLPAVLRETSRSLDVKFHHGRISGLVPGRVHIDDLLIESKDGPRVSLRWQSVDARLRLLELLRGRLVLARFSGHALQVRIASAKAPPATAEPHASRTTRMALAATRPSELARAEQGSLRIERLESQVERIDLGRFRLQGVMRLHANSVVLGRGRIDTDRAVLEADAVGVSRETVRVTRHLTGRAALSAFSALSVRRASVSPGPGPAWEFPRIRGKLTFRAVQPSFAIFPPLDRLVLGEGAFAVADLAVDPAGITGTLNLTSPTGARWEGVAGQSLSFKDTITLSATRRSADAPVRLDLSMPMVHSDCRSRAFCVEAVEGLRMATETRFDSELGQGVARDVEIRTGAARVSLADRTFATQGIGGLMKLGVDEDRSLLLDHGTLHLEQIDWLSGDGDRSLAQSAELGIDEGLVSEDIARVRGKIHAHGSNAGALFALAPVPWLRTIFAGVAGKPYSFDGDIRFEPDRFELEDARVSAGRLSVRGAHRSHGEKRSGAFLIRYGSWSIGAVFDENEVRPRFGVGERWLKRQLGHALQ